MNPKPSQPRDDPPYSRVEVLLLRWEDDHEGPVKEMENLALVFRKYGFGTTKWLIPSESSNFQLWRKAFEFVDKYASDNFLLIVYYGGHAANVTGSKYSSSWYCNKEPKRASTYFEWSDMRRLFENAASEVLLLLDCDAGSSSALTFGKGLGVTIAACSTGIISSASSRWSFTDVLIETLDKWLDRRFSARELHQALLSVLNRKNPENLPVCIHMASEMGLPGTGLSRKLSKISKHGSDKPSLHDITSITSKGEFRARHALFVINIAMGNGEDRHGKALGEWLASIPGLAKYASVQAIFKLHLLHVIAIVAVPLEMWKLVPKDYYVTFIDYIDSVNLVGSRDELDMRVVLRDARSNTVDDGDDVDNINVYSEKLTISRRT